MDKQEVIEFLAGVPLLRRLPTSSLSKIAQVVAVKYYDPGEYIVREGESGDGMYFLVEGEAEVKSSIDDGIWPEFHLKRHDYFGYGDKTAVHQADIIALSKLTSLVLQHENSNLLQAKSIWTAEENLETCADVERILHLEPLEVNIFKGITLPGAPNFGQVFGGQLIGQALAAASKSVDLLKFAHSLHAYFLITGNLTMPIVYQVHRLHDGKSFSSRRVDAIQQGVVIFTMYASFQKEELGFEHQEARMPSVPPPDELLSIEDLRKRRITDPRLPKTYRNKVVEMKFIPWPIDIRFCEPVSTKQTKSPPSLRYWFKARGELSDDQALHRCMVAYTSDLIFLQVSLNPHRGKGFKSRDISLNHALWFHRLVKADDWILYVIFTPTASNSRGYVEGQMFNRRGELVASIIQQGLIRKARTENSAIHSKL